MPDRADIGSRRLISLDPTGWVRWLLEDDTLDTLDLLSADFQWVGRESDAVLRVRSSAHGTFIVVNEIQLHYDTGMPARMRAYAALAHERYREPVYPVLVNVLPPSGEPNIPTRFESAFLGLVARQDYRVINLWEADADSVMEHELLPLLPFVPVLRGGAEAPVIRRALTRMRADPTLSELEPLLAFFASFVLDTTFVRRIMRWDMSVLRESPWYQQILKEGREEGRKLGREEGREEGRREGRREGREEGRQEGRQEGLVEGLRRARAEDVIRVLRHRFDAVPTRISDRLHTKSLEELEVLFDTALEVGSLDEFRRRISSDSTDTDGDRNSSRSET